MNQPDAVAVAEARRAIHELLTLLPAWDADKVRAALTEFERIHRNHVLAEGAGLIREHRGDMDSDMPWFDTRDRDHAAALLLAARTQQEQS